MRKREKRAAGAPVQWFSCGGRVSHAFGLTTIVCGALAFACLGNWLIFRGNSRTQEDAELTTAVAFDMERLGLSEQQISSDYQLYEEILDSLDDAAQITDAWDAELTRQDVALPVEAILQYPELPNGCEITSATIVLNYLGFTVDKLTMADTYLPRIEPWYEADPEAAYMGDPHGEGWYCYPAPIVTAVNAYLADAGADGDYIAVNATGADISDLKKYLRSGTPVIVWVTIGFAEPARSESSVLTTGEAPYTNLHCLVLTGYDEDCMYVADPLGLSTQVDIATFEEAYTAMGSRAVVIEKGAGE